MYWQAGCISLTLSYVHQEKQRSKCALFLPSLLSLPVTERRKQYEPAHLLNWNHTMNVEIGKSLK